MAVAFPSIEPTSRSFVPPRWPTTTSSSQSGVRTVRLWGSRPSQAQLSLAFDNIPDSQAAQIIEAHNSAKGNTIELTVPDILFAGAESSLQAWLKSSQNTGLKWFFTEAPPEVETIVPGRSSLRVTLSHELRMS